MVSDLQAPHLLCDCWPTVCAVRMAPRCRPMSLAPLVPYARCSLSPLLIPLQAQAAPGLLRAGW
eukprot:1195385-Prorocentrum_minimum.AAC.4